MPRQHPEHPTPTRQFLGRCGRAANARCQRLRIHHGSQHVRPRPGKWDLDWTGWWGPEPPYRVPVLALAHHLRRELVLGATTFTFVTDGIEAALALAERAAGDGTIAIACGAQTVQQYLRAGNLDVLRLHVVPVVLGAGERLLDSVGDLRWTQESVRASAGITHLTCRLSGI